MNVEPTSSPFQTCGSCKRAWAACEDFVLDSDVRLLGLQAVLIDSNFNVIVFEHRCGSSISILTRRLRHLLPGPEPVELPVLFGSDACRGHCRLLADLESCDAPCRNARDRELILEIQRRRASRSTGSAE